MILYPSNRPYFPLFVAHIIVRKIYYEIQNCFGISQIFKNEIRSIFIYLWNFKTIDQNNFDKIWNTG